MHSILNGMGSMTVMDDDLVDAARRVLFACTGARKQEHPELRQLGEFLHRYSLTQMSSSGEAGRCDARGPSLPSNTLLDAPGSATTGSSRTALHDNYEDAVRRARQADSHALRSISKKASSQGCARKLEYRSWRP